MRNRITFSHTLEGFSGRLSSSSLWSVHIILKFRSQPRRISLKGREKRGRGGRKRGGTSRMHHPFENREVLQLPVLSSTGRVCPIASGGLPAAMVAHRSVLPRAGINAEALGRAFPHKETQLSGEKLLFSLQAPSTKGPSSHPSAHHGPSKSHPPQLQTQTQTPKIDNTAARAEQQRQPIKEKSSKIQNSNQSVVLHANNLKPSSETYELFGKHFYFEFDNYSSQVSSQQQTAKKKILKELSEFQKDRDSQMSRKIWQGIDIRLRRMIESSSYDYRFKGEVNPTDGQNILQASRLVTIQPKELVFDRISQHEGDYHSDDMADNAEANIDLAKGMFARLQAVKLERGVPDEW